MLVQHLLQAIAERLHSSSSIHTIYGDPIEAQGKTLIPMAKVSYGFGGGRLARTASTVRTSSRQGIPSKEVAEEAAFAWFRSAWWK